MLYNLVVIFILGAIHLNEIIKLCLPNIYVNVLQVYVVKVLQHVQWIRIEKVHNVPSYVINVPLDYV